MSIPDISIGMDILSKLHLYFAFPERKLYVTRGDGTGREQVRLRRTDTRLTLPPCAKRPALSACCGWR